MTKEQKSFNNKSSTSQNLNSHAVNRNGGGGPPKNRRPRSTQGKQAAGNTHASGKGDEQVTPMKVKSNYHGKPNAATKRSPQNSSVASFPSNNEHGPDDKFSGSSFHQSPNAATLPRPPFAKPSSPSQKQSITPTPTPQPMISPPPQMQYAMPLPRSHHPAMNQYPHMYMPMGYGAAPIGGYPIMGYPPMMGAPMPMHFGGALASPMPMDIRQPSQN